MKNKNYVTSAEFAEKVGLTPQAVNKSAKLKDYRKKINGKSYIHIDAFALYGVPYAVAEKEPQAEQDKLKDEIQALKGELRLKNEEIEDLYRIIGEMYVENKSRQPLL